MTTTAQGTKLRCDHAGCQAIATVEKEAWAFCAAHAGGTPPPPRPATPRQDLSRAHTPATVATFTEPAVTRGPIGMLLEQASGHSSKRVRNLAEKIETQVGDLRALVVSLEEDERRRQAERAAKEKARQDIVRLEQQLAAARAALRGKPRSASPSTGRGGSAGRVLEQMPCRKNCGAVCNGPAGRSAHERHCAGQP